MGGNARAKCCCSRWALLGGQDWAGVDGAAHLPDGGFGVWGLGFGVWSLL